MWLEIWSDLLFCGSIFIVVTRQKCHVCYMGYLKLEKYKLAGGLTTPRCRKIWSDLVNLKYLVNKESLTKVSSMCWNVTKIHIWVRFTPPQVSHPSELTGLTKKNLTAMLNATDLNSQTFWETWVRGTWKILYSLFFHVLNYQSRFLPCLFF